MDADLIDPTRDRVWAVDVTVSYTAYVVAETAREAERIAENEGDEDDARYTANELTEPPNTEDGVIPYGRSYWQDRQITVDEAVELIARHKPAYDTRTALMPFADSPPPLCPPRIEDYLAAMPGMARPDTLSRGAGRCER